MSGQYDRRLRQADQAHADFATIDDQLELIRATSRCLPTRVEVAELVLLETLALVAVALLAAMLVR